jgi:hypothetical protein
MLDKLQKTELGRIRRDLKILRDRWSWPCDAAAIAELCGRSFQSVDALAQHFETPLGGCFRPGQAKGTGPAALCCRALKAISDLHSHICDEEHKGDQSEKHSLSALDKLISSLDRLSIDAGAEASPAAV